LSYVLINFIYYPKIGSEPNVLRLKCETYVRIDSIDLHNSEFDSNLNPRYICFWNECKFRTNDFKSFELHQFSHNEQLKLLNVDKTRTNKRKISYNNKDSNLTTIQKSKVIKTSQLEPTSGKYL
jgi:hypothetical protein